MNVTTIGLDLAKNVFHVHGVDAHGKAVLRKRLNRGKLLEFFANLPRCLVGMEACPGAHYWAREFEKLGHEVKLMPAQYVRPYVKRNKNDPNDAEGICEAVSRPSMHFVSVNTAAQQAIQLVHRIRSRLVGQRTALINQLRGLLGEYGFVFSQGLAPLRQGVARLLGQAEQHALSSLALQGLTDLMAQWRELDERIAAYDGRIKRLCQEDARSQKLIALPGVGPLTATAIVAAVNDGTQFKKARQMAAHIGLTPYEHSTGGKQRLLGISKRGDIYLRTLLIHGARTVLKYAPKKTDPLSRWVSAVAARRGFNRAAVALANKLARIAWALLAHDRTFQPQRANP
jgi:transposase